MGSSAKTGKNFFRGSPEHFLDKNGIWDRTPPTYTSIVVYMCGGGFKGPKSSNRIQLSRFVQKFLVILLSPWSPWSPRCPHVIPVIPTSSLCRPCHPHIISIVPRRFPCGPHGLWSPLSPWSPPHVVPVVPTSSLSSPHCPRVIPVIPMSSRRSPHHL